MTMRSAALLGTILLLSPLAAAAQDALPPPVQAVAQVLQLTPDQLASLVQMIQQRDQASAPIAQQIHAREDALGKLLQADAPDPAAVGQLAIEITKLRQQLAGVGADARLEFEGTLDPEQIDKLSNIRLAAQLEQVLPPFRAVGLVW